MFLEWENNSDKTKQNDVKQISLSHVIKKINLLHLRRWSCPWKFMNFSEAAIGGVLWKKLLLKISQYSQESCRPATLLKTDSNTGVFLWILRDLKENLFQRTSADCCFWFFKTATEQRWATASVLSLLLSSDNLLTGYEQLSY